MASGDFHSVHDEDAGPNGAAMAAFLGAGIGALAMGAVVILNEAGQFAAPGLYPPAGGVSGRTTIAVATWLIAWGLLHLLWRRRTIRAAPIGVTTIILILLGVAACFPPLWSVL